MTSASNFSASSSAACWALAESASVARLKCSTSVRLAGVGQRRVTRRRGCRFNYLSASAVTPWLLTDGFSAFILPRIFFSEQTTKRARAKATDRGCRFKYCSAAACGNPPPHPGVFNFAIEIWRLVTRIIFPSRDFRGGHTTSCQPRSNNSAPGKWNCSPLFFGGAGG